MYLFFTYVHKRNNVTVAYFLKFMTIYSLNFMCLDILPTESKLCVFSYMPKYQSSGPYGPVFTSLISPWFSHCHDMSFQINISVFMINSSHACCFRSFNIYPPPISLMFTLHVTYNITPGNKEYK